VGQRQFSLKSTGDTCQGKNTTLFSQETGFDILRRTGKVRGRKAQKKPFPIKVVQQPGETGIF
jgi:hypothetical protein